MDSSNLARALKEMVGSSKADESLGITILRLAPACKEQANSLGSTPKNSGTHINLSTNPIHCLHATPAQEHLHGDVLKAQGVDPAVLAKNARQLVRGYITRDFMAPGGCSSFMPRNSTYLYPKLSFERGERARWVVRISVDCWCCVHSPDAAPHGLFRDASSF